MERSTLDGPGWGRRVLVTGVLVALVVGGALGLLAIARAATRVVDDPAYQALSAIALAHDGQASYDAAARRAEARAVARPVAGGTRYSMTGSAGVCWSVVVPAAGPTRATPAEAPAGDCA